MTFMPFMFYTFYELYIRLAEITGQSDSFLCDDIITMAAKRNPCFVLNNIFSVS